MSENVEDLKKRLAETESRAAKWEKLHTESTIRRELLAAAARGGAYHGPQLLPWLEKNAKLEEANGQSVVRIVTTNDDGKEVRHTPDEAVANMKRQAAHANLFHDTMDAKPTLATPATPAKVDLRKLMENMPQEQFLKLRAEQPELFGLDPLPKKGR
jgi:hypothetical protein